MTDSPDSIGRIIWLRMLHKSQNSVCVTCSIAAFALGCAVGQLMRAKVATVATAVQLKSKCKCSGAVIIPCRDAMPASVSLMQPVRLSSTK